MWTCCVCMETIRPNYRPRDAAKLPRERAPIMCPKGARPARPHARVADDASPAAYGSLVGGTMVLAGVCGVVPPGPGERTDLGCDQCGHFAVSGTAVGDHSRGADPGRVDQGRACRRGGPVRVLPGLDRNGRRHPEIPELDSGHHQLDPVLTARSGSGRSARSSRRAPPGCPASRMRKTPGPVPENRARGHKSGRRESNPRS